MKRVLLVNPPIYDFAAYDFWLKPYGLLGVGGRLRGRCEMRLFDFLDRLHPEVEQALMKSTDRWNRGKFPEKRLKKPPIYRKIPRHYRRFGLEESVFEDFLVQNGPFDAALVGTVMTYWYPGVREVIDTIRRVSPSTRIVLGGFYASICPEHAGALGADLVIRGGDFGPLWDMLELPGSAMESVEPPLWEAYPKLRTGVLKLTRGCPFRCTYCSVPQSGEGFSARPLREVLAELDLLMECGVRDIAFYDDALLFAPERILYPFLDHVIRHRARVNLHTPNAMHARLLGPEAAERLVAAGTKTFYLGFESAGEDFQARTGSKVGSPDLKAAVEALAGAGAEVRDIVAYEMLGHPRFDIQRLEESMRYAHSLGIRIQLSDFSPIPGTPDGDLGGRWVDLDEPLSHNKTYFPIVLLGFERSNYFKQLCRELNSGV